MGTEPVPTGLGAKNLRRCPVPTGLGAKNLRVEPVGTGLGGRFLGQEAVGTGTDFDDAVLHASHGGMYRTVSAVAVAQRTMEEQGHQPSTGTVAGSTLAGRRDEARTVAPIGKG